MRFARCVYIIKNKNNFFSRNKNNKNISNFFFFFFYYLFLFIEYVYPFRDSGNLGIVGNAGNLATLKHKKASVSKHNFACPAKSLFYPCFI